MQWPWGTRRRPRWGYESRVSPRHADVAAFLASVLVAFSGVIGFVGLMMPHVARMFVGADNRAVIPLSLLFGSIFLLWADVFARTVIAPTDVPIGIVTGFVGGLFFLVLLRRTQPS